MGSRILINYLPSYTDTLALASSLRDLSSCSRQARTAMWCALKVTLLHKDGVVVESDTEPDTDDNETEIEFEPELEFDLPPAQALPPSLESSDAKSLQDSKECIS